MLGLFGSTKLKVFSYQSRLSQNGLTFTGTTEIAPTLRWPGWFVPGSRSPGQCGFANISQNFLHIGGGEAVFVYSSGGLGGPARIRQAVCNSRNCCGQILIQPRTSLVPRDACRRSAKPKANAPQALRERWRHFRLLDGKPFSASHGKAGPQP